MKLQQLLNNVKQVEKSNNSFEHKIKDLTFIENNKKLNPDAVTHNLVLLNNYIDYFESNGVKVVFYFTPFECSMQSALSFQETIMAYHQKFPENKFDYMPQELCDIYHTTDGLHLTNADAQIFSRAFEKYILKQ